MGCANPPAHVEMRGGVVGGGMGLVVGRVELWGVETVEKARESDGRWDEQCEVWGWRRQLGGFREPSDSHLNAREGGESLGLRGVRCGGWRSRLRGCANPPACN